MKDEDNTYKEKQLQIILENNPKDNSLSNHTWIESVDDIHTFQECCHIDRITTPDFFQADINKALETKKIRVYSSYPIKQGTWVTPSKMEAKNYAGSGEVYHKDIFLEDVAWIDSLEGMYASVKEYEFEKKMKENSSEKQLSNPNDLESYKQVVYISDLNGKQKKIDCYVVDKDVILDKDVDLGNCILFCNNIIGNNHSLSADVIVTRDIKNMGNISSAYIQGTSLKAKSITMNHDTNKYDLNDLIDLNRQKGMGNSFQIGLRDQLPAPINLDFDIVIGDLYWQQETIIEPFRINITQDDWIMDEADYDRVGFEGGKVLVSKIDGANGILAGDINAMAISAYNVYSVRDTGQVVKLEYGGIPKIEDREDCVFDYVKASLGNVNCSNVCLGDRGLLIARNGVHRSVIGAKKSKVELDNMIADYACVEIINADILEAKTIFAEHVTSSSVKTDCAVINNCNVIDVEVKDCLVVDNANIIDLTVASNKTVVKTTNNSNIRNYNRSSEKQME